MVWRTMQDWNSRGRYIATGEKNRLRDPDTGECLWSKDQTVKSNKKAAFARSYEDEDEFAGYDYPFEYEMGIGIYKDD